MAFKNANQRKAVMAKIRKLPDNLINPHFIPKGSKYATDTKSKIRQFFAKPTFHIKKNEAIKTATKTNRNVYIIPKRMKVFSVRSDKGKYIVIRK